MGNDVIQDLPIGSAWEFLNRNWALISIFFTVSLLVTLPLLVLRKYVRLMLNIIQDTLPPLSIMPTDFERVEGDRVVFRAFDNLNLVGMFLTGRHAGRARGMVIFFHEYGSDRYSAMRYCKGLLDVGYDLFTFDFRGHGESSNEPDYKPRQWPSDREVNDALGAIAFVEDWLEDHGRPIEVGLLGISRGAGAAIIAGANTPAVKAIISDGAFSSDLTIEYFMKRWAYIFARIRFVYENHPPQFWRFLRWLLFCECKRKLGCAFPSAVKAIRYMHPPKAMLFIHGQRDSYIPVEQSQRLYETSATPHGLWICPGAKHNQSVALARDYYMKRTVEWFDRYLSRQTEAPPAKSGAAAPPEQEFVTLQTPDQPEAETTTS